jgi:phosphoribosylanthranilate isomerase
MTGSMARVRVKICGITCREDAEEAIACGADALGFNSWPATRRYIDLKRAEEWMRELPPFVSRVALCVNASLTEAQEVADSPAVDLLQFHGDETAAYCEEFAATRRKPFIKALRVRSEADLAGIDRFSTRHVLIDAHVEGQFGGTGSMVNLDLARQVRDRFPALTLIVAGGLRPENVADAVRVVSPFAVDVSSGVESEVGRKDRALMRAFVQAVRSAE